MSDPYWSLAAEGEISFMDQRSVIRATGERTGGAFSITETSTPEGGGPPPHVHEREDESFYVLEGEYAVTVGEETIAAEPGAFVFAPRGIPHSYVSRAAWSRHLTLVSPPGFERFFGEAAVAAADGPDELAKVAKSYGVTLLGPPSGGTA